MARFVILIARIAIFPAAIILMAFRLALGIVLSFLAPIVLPVLVLLSGGGLVVSIAFASAGHWHDAAKGLWACFVCSVALGLFAGVVQLVNPYIFSAPVTITNRRFE